MKLHPLILIPGLVWIINICTSPVLLSAGLSDSLRESWADLPDTLYVKSLLDYAYSSYRTDPETSLSLTQEAIAMSEKEGFSKLMARGYSLAGVLLKNKGDYSSALQYHINSLHINERLQIKAALASNYNDIGIVYKSMENYEKALEAYLQANTIATELGMQRGMVMTLNNIGTIYEALDDNSNSIQYYQQAYSLAIEFDIMDAQAIVLNNLGEIHAQIGEGEQAREFFHKTLAIDQQTGDRIGSVSSLLNIAATYIFESRYDSASKYLQQAQDLAIELRATQLMIHVLKSYTSMYEKQGNYQKAFEHASIAQAYQDSLFNETQAKLLAEAEARFEAGKKDREIELLRQEQFLKEVEIKSHKAERLALISLILLGAISGYYLYRRHKSKQQHLFNQKMIRQKEEFLNTIVETQEQERKRIAKDLHDGIGQMLSGVKLALATIEQSDELRKKNKQKIGELKNIVDEACSEVRTISHQMMPRVLQEDGLIAAISEMLEKVFRHTNVEYLFEHHNITQRFQENIEIGLYRICQELINNIIKHSDATKVTVQLIKTKKLLILIVEDNGKGMEPAGLDRQGIGLMNITSRVETIQGEFNLEPSPESGTLATIRIPIE